LISCGEVQKAQSQLEIRSFQTKEFDVADTKMVMKAIVDTLQDEGFSLKNVDTTLGIINATKEVDIEDKYAVFFATLLAGNKARWKKLQNLEASVSVTPIGNRTKVRVNFSMKLIDNEGKTIKVETVKDPNYYQDFFSKVSKSLFLLQEKI
jgi:hypothetical protein